jgi:hypothetical protein
MVQSLSDLSVSAGNIQSLSFPQQVIASWKYDPALVRLAAVGATDVRFLDGVE